MSTSCSTCSDSSPSSRGGRAERMESSLWMVSLLKTRLSQRSCVVRSDRLFGRSWSDGLGSFFGHSAPGSHAPRVGAGESRAAAATRRVESASATAAADGDGPDLLDRVVETLEELAEFLAGGAARDGGAVAPPGLQCVSITSTNSTRKVA